MRSSHLPPRPPLRLAYGQRPLLQALVSQKEPRQQSWPVPPHASWTEMKETAKSLLKGDEDRWGVVKEGVKTKVAEVLPGGSD